MRCKVDKAPTTDSMMQNHVDKFENTYRLEVKQITDIELDRQFHRSIKAVEKF
jgi:hypothetical protein